MEDNEVFTGKETDRKMLALQILTDKWDKFHELIGAVSKKCNLDPFEMAPAFLMNTLLNECILAKKHGGTLVNLKGFGEKAQEKLDAVGAESKSAELLGMLRGLKDMLEKMEASKTEEEDEEEEE